LFEGALFVLPTEVWVTEVNAGRHRSVLRVAGLPLCEVLLHRVARHVPREHIADGVAFISSDPEACWAVACKLVQVHHVHLLVKPCKLSKTTASLLTEILGLAPVLRILKELIAACGHLSPGTVGHEEEDVVEQEEEPSPGSSREENGDYDGRDDTFLAIAAGLDLDQVCLLVLLAAPAPR